MSAERTFEELIAQLDQLAAELRAHGEIDKLVVIIERDLKRSGLCTSCSHQYALVIAQVQDTADFCDPCYNKLDPS